MKKAFLIVISLFMVLTVPAKDIPDSQVPAEVKAYISQNYPKAKRADWGYEEKKNYYSAEFFVDGREVKLEITADGKLLFLEENIFIRDIPANLTAYIKQNYQGAEITDAKKKIENGVTTYSIRMVTITDKGGSKYQIIVMSEKGDVIKQ